MKNKGGGEYEPALDLPQAKQFAVMRKKGGNAIPERDMSASRAQI